MKIIGGHDYYDSVGGYSEDDRVFIRQKPYSYDTKDTHEWVKLSLPLPPFSPHLFRENINSMEVIFCGKHYFSLYFTESLHGSLTTTYIWNFKTFKKFIDEGIINFDDYRYRYYGDQKKKTLEIIEKAFTPTLYVKDYELINNGVVIATREGPNFNKEKDYIWSKNPVGLKDIGFASVVPPWEAYQEIEMYLGTILVNDKDRMVNVSDKVKLSKYGFDKWSFKNKVHNSKPRGA
jgi:hypothetical protein